MSVSQFTSPHVEGVFTQNAIVQGVPLATFTSIMLRVSFNWTPAPKVPSNTHELVAPNETLGPNIISLTVDAPLERENGIHPTSPLACGLLRLIVKRPDGGLANRCPALGRAITPIYAPTAYLNC